MSRKTRREKYRNEKVERKQQEASSYFDQEIVDDARLLKKFSPMNSKQKQFMNLIRSNQIIFCIGPPGTSKSYTSTSMAVQALMNKEIDKLVISRPAVVACGENLGFLKGDLSDKYNVFLEPFIDIFHEQLGVSHTENLLRNKRIEPKPLAYLRGKSFSLYGKCWVLVDECQGYDPEQFLLLLTRIGEDTKIIFTGDVKQRDNYRRESGLTDAINRLSGIDGVGVMEFTKEDIVRAGIIKDILNAYEK